MCATILPCISYVMHQVGGAPERLAAWCLLQLHVPTVISCEFYLYHAFVLHASGLGRGGTPGRLAAWCSVHSRVPTTMSVPPLCGMHPLNDFVLTLWTPYLLRQELGLSPEQTRRCCNKLHYHAVTSAHSIVCLRRELEQTTGTRQPRPGEPPR